MLVVYQKQTYYFAVFFHCISCCLQEGVVYAVEFSLRSGRDLVNMAKKRTNVVPIVEDARHPHKYRMIVGMVDTIFADVAQPDQARIVSINAQHFLKVSFLKCVLCDFCFLII